MDIVISKSDNKNKKYKAVIDGKKTVHFGAKGYDDFTTHKDKDRKDNYIARHKKREDWTRSGVDTAGFYAKHILWNKDTLSKSVDNLNKQFKSLNVKLK